MYHQCRHDLLLTRIVTIEFFLSFFLSFSARLGKRFENNASFLHLDKKKYDSFVLLLRARILPRHVRRKAIGDPMEPAQTSSFELGVVNHRQSGSTPRFEDDTAREIFPRNEDDMDEDVFLPRENGEGREEEERNVVEIPRGYRRPRRELMRQIPVTDPTNDGARVRSNRVTREVEFSRNEYRNFWNVSKKVVACVLVAACVGLVYICTHEFSHAAACALTKEHRVVKISILSVTIFERPVTFDYAPREEEDAEDNHNEPAVSLGEERFS